MSQESSRDIIFGFFWGLLVSFIIAGSIVSCMRAYSDSDVKKYSISHGLGHFDRTSGEYIQDSIYFYGDSILSRNGIVYNLHAKESKK